MDYTDFFAEYKHPHTRHDPVGSEDSDVNNDGKVDKNDKYIMAKRRLYKQYQATQTSKKNTDFSTPKLENNMIRLSGLVNLKALKEDAKEPQVVAPTADDKKGDLEIKLKKLKSMQMTPDQEKKVDEMLAQMEGLTAGQKKLDVDKDGEIEGSDLAALRAKKDEVVLENEDHEVPMAHSALDSIIRHATELKGKVGMQDKDLPAWIQDHITNAENYIDQANTGYHEYSQEKDAEADTPTEPGEMNEEAPTGWEKTVLAMKKHKEIDNPWALAHWMKKKGYQHKKEEKQIKESVDESIGSLAAALGASAAGVAAATGSKGQKLPRRARKVGVRPGKKGARGTPNKMNSGKTVKNPKTGTEILATTAYAAGPSHPAYSAAKSALGIK